MPRPDLPYWLALMRFTKFGAVRLRKLAEYFLSMERAFHASAEDLTMAGIDPALAEQFAQARLHLDPALEIEKLQASGAVAITLFDETYPVDLKQIHDPPAVLIYRGTLPPPAATCLAVVGSRKPTDYGARMVERLIKPLAQSGLVIVSGLAHGIDALAHLATLAVEGATLGVLGNGVDDQSIYPTLNRHLARHMISRRGAILSEFPLGTPSLRHHFPFRNRIIAGLCKGTLVIEAAAKSGSLITARQALENGRDVFAVPGPADAEMSEGPNNLIKMGAIPVTGPEDIFNHLGMKAPEPGPEKKITPDSAEEAAILQQLTHEPRHADEIVKLTGLPAPKVASTLTLMEMKGAARHAGGLYYTKN
jgi:DNA processing protein